MLKDFSLWIHVGERRGECGLRSIIISMGALDGYNIRSGSVLRRTFGVGYGVAMFERRDKQEAELVNRIYARKQEHMARSAKVRIRTSVWLGSLESYIRTGEIIKPGSELPKEMLEEKAGVFVSNKKEWPASGLYRYNSTSKRQYCWRSSTMLSVQVSVIPVLCRLTEANCDLVYSVDVLKT